MPNHSDLHKAKKNKNDEFYTQYSDIQKELNNYEQHFKGKTVLCNCDDPFESNFCKFFLRNFNFLGLKRLICTSYNESPVAGTQISLLDIINGVELSEGHGYVLDVRKVPMANGRGVSDEDIDKLLRSKKHVRELLGNGDFRSDECVEYLKQADIIVTNPPFSLFREYIAQLMRYGKQFLVIANINAITYKEVFPLIKDNKMWLGTGMGRWISGFIVPDTYELSGTEAYINERGERIVATNNCLWFTNLDHNKRHEKLVLYKSYTPEEYPHYDNFNAINVDKTSDIPMDYDGIMGVPITFLDKYNPEQFEIIDCTHTTNPELWSGNHEVSYYKDFKRGKVVTNADASMPLLKTDISGGTKCVRKSDGAVLYQLYHRLFIRRKESTK